MSIVIAQKLHRSVPMVEEWMQAWLSAKAVKFTGITKDEDIAYGLPNMIVQEKSVPPHFLRFFILTRTSAPPVRLLPTAPASRFRLIEVLDVKDRQHDTGKSIPPLTAVGVVFLEWTFSRVSDLNSGGVGGYSRSQHSEDGDRGQRKIFVGGKRELRTSLPMDD